MPAVQRTRGRLRRRQPRDHGRPRRRRVDRERPEGVDQPGAPRALGAPVRAHRPRRPEAPGHDLLRDRHAPARGRGATAPPDDRPGRVQRGLLHGRTRPRREPDRRRRRRLARRAHDPDERARLDRRFVVRRRLDADPVGARDVARPSRQGRGAARPGRCARGSTPRCCDSPISVRPRRGRSASPDRKGRSRSSRPRSSTSASSRCARTCSAPTGCCSRRATRWTGRTPASATTPSRNGSCAAARTRSRAARPRSCATSSASGSSASPATSASTRTSPGRDVPRN